MINYYSMFDITVTKNFVEHYFKRAFRDNIEVDVMCEFNCPALAFDICCRIKHMDISCTFRQQVSADYSSKELCATLERMVHELQDDYGIEFSKSLLR